MHFLPTPPPGIDPAGRSHLSLVPPSRLAPPGFSLPGALGVLPPFVLARGRPGRRRHVLLIDAALPAPGARPAAGAVLSHAAALRRLGFEVSFCPADLCLDRAEGDQGGTSALEGLGVACLGRPAYRTVEEVLSRNGAAFDVVMLHGGVLAQAYAPVVRLHAAAARVLFCSEALSFLALERQAGVLGRAELMVAAQAAQRREMLAAYACDGTLVPSAHEAGLLRAALPGHAVHVVPWAPGAADAAPGRADGAGVGFQLRGRGEAEVDAATFLVQAVMPLVWAEQPGLDLVVAGGGGMAALRGHKGVTVLDEAERLLDRVRVTVAPHRFGSGVCPAVVESLAAGVPCAMSPVAAEGVVLPPALAGWVAPGGSGLAAGLAGIVLALHGRRPAEDGWGGAVRAAWSDAGVDAALRGALDVAPARLRAVQ